MSEAGAAHVLASVRVALGEELPAEERLRRVCQILADGLEGYDWVGFYLVDPRTGRDLVLGPYVGAPTEHTRIPFGAGICGQAAEALETFVVRDVSAEENYLACSLEVRSEIVVPVFHEGRLVGELDIDSHQLARFGGEDQRIVEEVASLAGPACATAVAEGHAA